MKVANVIKSEAIRKSWAEGKQVFVHGWIYEIENGRLRDLCITVGPDSLASS